MGFLIRTTALAHFQILLSLVIPTKRIPLLDCICLTTLVHTSYCVSSIVVRVFLARERHNNRGTLATSIKCGLCLCSVCFPFDGHSPKGVAAASVVVQEDHVVAAVAYKEAATFGHCTHTCLPCPSIQDPSLTRGGVSSSSSKGVHSAGGGRRPVKIWNAARTVRKALVREIGLNRPGELVMVIFFYKVVSTYEEFHRKGREKLGLGKVEPVRVVLESDGTQVN